MDDFDRKCERPLEKLPPVSMDYRELAALVFELNKLMSTAKKHVIGKLSRKIKTYRLKSTRKISDGSDRMSGHDDERSERLLEQISTIKSLDAARISKFSLANEETVDSISRKPNSTNHLIALVRLAEEPLVKNYVHNWRSKHTDWKVLANFLLSKNTNRLFKRRNQKKTLTTDKLIVDREIIKHRLLQDNSDIVEIDKPLMERTSKLGAKHSQRSQDKRSVKNEESAEKVTEQSADSGSENEKATSDESSDDELESDDSTDVGESDKDMSEYHVSRPPGSVDDDGFDSKGYDDFYQTDFAKVEQNDDTNQLSHTQLADSDSDESSLDENDLLTFNIVDDDLKQMEQGKIITAGKETEEASTSKVSSENTKIKSLADKLLSGSNKLSDSESESEVEEPVKLGKVSGEMVTARLDITSLKKSNYKSLEEVTPVQSTKQELSATSRRKKSSFFMGGEIEIDEKLGSSRYEQEQARKNQRSGGGYKGVKKSEKKWIQSAFTDSLRGSKKSSEHSHKRNHDQLDKGDTFRNQLGENGSKFRKKAEMQKDEPIKNNKKNFTKSKNTGESIESLHPSWQASKKQKMQQALIQNGPKATKKTFDDSD